MRFNMKRLLCGLFLVSALVSAASSGRAADRVLLYRIGPTQGTLYLANADGSGEHALLPPGALDYDPAWSPKGDWIAFTSERNGSADLYRVHPDGAGLERLTDNRAYDDQAAFSPDGKQIVFVSTRAAGYANLWVQNLATHKARLLTPGKGGDFRPSWSPDGKWIAFSTDRDSDLPNAKGRWERLHVTGIALIHPDGTGFKRLTAKNGNACGSPKWTADSASVIAYCMPGQDTWDNRAGQGEADDSLQKMDIATGTATTLPAGPGVKIAPFALPSGEIGFLRRDKAEKGVFYASGKHGPQGADIRVPSWSPDGSQLVYSRVLSQPRLEATPTWSRNPHFELFLTSWLPAVDAPHNRFVASQFTGNKTTLYVMEDGKPGRAILERPDLILAPQWSPDGKQIVIGVGQFSSFLDFAVGNKKPVDPANGGAQVALLNEDGGDLKLLTSGPNNNGFPSFAPDGKQIVYRTAGPEGEGLRLLNLADRTITKLTEAWDNFPIWSPRGDRIAFVRRTGNDFQVFTIHPDGTGLRQLTRTKGNDAHLAWAPDGEHLLFTSSRMGFKDEALYIGAPQPYGEVFSMRPDGSGIEQLTDDQWEEGVPAWLPPAPKGAGR